MPRSNIGKDPAEIRRGKLKEATRRIIRRGMGERGYRQYQVAEKIGMSPARFSVCLKEANFSHEQLCDIVAVLHLSIEDAGSMLWTKR